ncbi:MAG: hypothetical protein V3W31_10405 [Thermodesulfobacteriota bacterium]
MLVPDSLRARARVELTAKELKGRAVILVKRPDLVRIEILGPLGQAVSVLVSDSRRIALYSEGKVKSYRWDDPAQPYPFGARELVSFLMGMPRGTYPEGGGRAGRGGRGDSGGSGGDYEFSTDGDGRVSKLVKFEDGVLVLKAAMEDYREIEGVVVPMSVSIENGEGERLLISYSSVEVNPEMERELFNLPDSISTP